MPRPITRRFVQLAEPSSSPAVIPQINTYFNQPMGIDLRTPLSRLGTDLMPDAQNFRLSMAQRLVVRDGYAAFGAAAGSEVVGLAIVSNASGLEWAIRVTQTGVDLYSASWEALTGPALNLAITDYAEFAAWGDSTVLFTDGVNGLWAVDLNLGTYSLVAGAPIAKHLTVFGGRVVLSNIVNEPNRIQWSVKNDYTDWVGIGSGFEDMLSAPGGVVDIQQGIFPLTDQEAMVVRSNSVWIMTLTGDPDAPFYFSYRFNEGTDSPRSIVRVTGSSLMMLGKSNVVILTTSGVEPIANNVRTAMVGGSYDVRLAQGCWDEYEMEYRLWVPPSSYIWRFHTPSGKWLRDSVPFTPRLLSQGNKIQFLTIGQLTGTIGQLQGTIGNLGVQGRRKGILVAQSGGRVVAETEGATTDTLADGTTTPIVATLVSGQVLPGGPLARAIIALFEMECFTSRAVTVVIEYSQDAGSTWSTYGTFSLSSSGVPQVVMYRNTIERSQCIFRIRSLDAAGFQLYAAHLHTLPSAPRNF